jgi:hypothetical protein
VGAPAAGLRRGNRSEKDVSAIRPSSRASGAPMQKWAAAAEGEVAVRRPADVELVRRS